MAAKKAQQQVEPLIRVLDSALNDHQLIQTRKQKGNGPGWFVPHSILSLS